jgi:hypothetical protein
MALKKVTVVQINRVKPLILKALPKFHSWIVVKLRTRYTRLPAKRSHKKPVTSLETTDAGISSALKLLGS